MIPSLAHQLSLRISGILSALIARMNLHGQYYFIAQLAVVYPATGCNSATNNQPGRGVPGRRDGRLEACAAEGSRRLLSVAGQRFYGPQQGGSTLQGSVSFFLF